MFPSGSSGFLRGYSALQGGEESDSCAAGQGRRFAARRTAVDIRPTAACMIGDARLAITKPVGSTAGLAGSQVCGACVRHLGGTPSLALTGDATGVEAENSTREGRIPLLQLGEMSIDVYDTPGNALALSGASQLVRVDDTCDGTAIQQAQTFGSDPDC